MSARRTSAASAGSIRIQPSAGIVPSNTAGLVAGTEIITRDNERIKFI